MVAILENFNQLERVAASAKATPDKPIVSQGQKRSRAEVKTRVANRIKKKLEFLNYSGSEKNELVLVFTRDMDRLTSVVDQWVAFISSFQHETFIDLRGGRFLTEAQKQEVATDIESLFSKAKTVRVTDDSVLVDSIFALEFEEMKDKLGTQLDKSVSSLVQQFFSLLYELKARNILGGLSWASDVSCRFFDWNHQIEIIRGPEFNRTVREGNLMVKEKGVSGVEMLHTAARREQHLMEAKSDTVRDFSGEVPEAFKKVIKQMPECLLPEIRIISGEAFRNEKVRHCLKRKRWGETVIEREVLRDLRVRFDPAITIGDIVLFAWDADDSIADAKRDSSVEKSIWAISLAVASVVLFHLFANQDLGLRVLLASPLILGSGWLCAMACKERMEFQRRVPRMDVQNIAFCGAASLAGALIVLSLAIGSGQWLLFIVAAPLLYVTVKSASFVFDNIQK